MLANLSICMLPPRDSSQRFIVLRAAGRSADAPLIQPESISDNHWGDNLR
jgi:hypothetical protein